MTQRQTSPSEDNFDSPPAGPRTVPFPYFAPSEPQAPSRGRSSVRTATRRPRRLGLPSPPPARTPADSTASSYRSSLREPSQAGLPFSLPARQAKLLVSSPPPGAMSGVLIPQQLPREPSQAGLPLSVLAWQAKLHVSSPCLVQRLES
ncbi:hypothetical protein ROHU_027718 [Labeo rohita]|uniref:Uncharacterized protein n=1 Tax=Labeo rohita TaxID=84645 RepID=A0A498M6F8_LABRO|nr:hypothetical protein ROHU_027718 [Labeo rohita]